MCGRSWALVAALVGAVVTIGACGAGGSTRPGGGAARLVDIDATPRGLIKEGGVLRWPIEQFSTQWNYNQLNGPETSTAAVIGALMPAPFLVDASGNPYPDHDYLLGYTVRSSPQHVVTLELNPRARWSDGTPITWRDYAAQWKALSGSNPAFQVASTTGYDRIANVQEGRGPDEVVITFRKPFGDWKALFGPLYPAATNATPDAFDTSYLGRIPVTGGPFRLGSINQIAQTVTVARDPSWWGDPAKLDQIIFRALTPDAAIGAFANGEVDFVGVTSASDLQRASSAPNAAVRESGGPNIRQLTLNSQSPALADVRVRQAIVLGIDRTALARSDLKGLNWPTTLLDNHVFMPGQTGYQDDAGRLGTYSAGAAASMLDAAGWRLQGQYRVKDGAGISLRFVIPAGVQASLNEANLVQTMMQRIGVKIDIVTVPSNQFFDRYISPGDFDIAPFSWAGTPFPISSTASLYEKPTGQDIRQNYTRAGSDQIDGLFMQAIGTMDAAQADKLANQADAAIWQEAASLPLYQDPNIVVANRGLGNIGAAAFQSLRYQSIGWKR